MDTKVVYVYLANEGTDVWRPTLGEDLGDGFYRLLSSESYCPEDEEWEFPPGTVVRCEARTLRDTRPHQVLVAVERRVEH